MEGTAVLKYEGVNGTYKVRCSNLSGAMRSAYHMYRGSNYRPTEIVAGREVYSFSEIKRYWQDCPEDFPLRSLKKYRKKPVVVSAGQWWKRGDVPDARVQPYNPHSKSVCTECGNKIALHGKCPTLEGHHIVCPGDYIIRGVKGEYYPCKPDIFEETYESVE